MNRDVDRAVIRISLASDRMRQLEDVASECGLDPDDLARAWIIERLMTFSSHGGGLAMTSPPRAKTASLRELGRPVTSLVTAKTPPGARSLREMKEMLADKYIIDADEKALFLQTNRFKQWANYIAGLVLTNRGEASFTPTDVKKILSRELIPDHYGRSGALANEVLTADVRVDAPPDYPHGYPCLRRVDWGSYEFAGFVECIRERYGEEDLRTKLSRAKSSVGHQT